MVLSFTCSNRNGNIGFLSGENGKRGLYIAMTCAKNHCALFADTKMWLGLSMHGNCCECEEMHSM